MRGASPAAAAAPRSFFFASHSREVEEAQLTTLAALVDQGTLDAYTLVWANGLAEWGTLGDASTLEQLGVADEAVRRRLLQRSDGGPGDGCGGGGAPRPAEEPLDGAPAEEPEVQPEVKPGSPAASTPSEDDADSPPFCSVRYVDPETQAPTDEVAVDTLRRALADGTITAQGLVWTDGMEDWTPLTDCFAQFGLVRAELGIMRQHIELQMSQASAAHRREIRTPIAGTEWDKVEVIEQASAGEAEAEVEAEVYFIHRETGESAWELDPETVRQAADAVSGVARPSGGGWLARENKALAAGNARLQEELDAAVGQWDAAKRREAVMKRQLLALQQENTALRSRQGSGPPHV